LRLSAVRRTDNGVAAAGEQVGQGPPQAWFVFNEKDSASHYAEPEATGSVSVNFAPPLLARS
jgi:hypothetical protein